MGLSFSHETNIISVTSPQVEVTMQELADAIAEFEAEPVSMGYGDVATIEGKFDKGGGKKSEIIVQLNSPWQLQFWGGSGVTTTSGGSLLGGLGGVPVKATGTAGDLTLVQQPVDGTLLEVGTSGLTPAESDALLAIEADVATMQTDVSGIKVSITGIEGDVATIQTDIGSVQVDLATATKIMRNKKVTNESTGVLTVYEDNGVDVFLEANLYESVDTSQAYRGQGVQRQERLE